MKIWKFQIKKLKFIYEDSSKSFKVNRRSTLTDNQLENCFESDIFTYQITDESSEYSGESNINEIDQTPLTTSFKITPSETGGNCIFQNLNDIVFSGKLTAEYIWEEIGDFII